MRRSSSVLLNRLRLFGVFLIALNFVLWPIVCRAQLSAAVRQTFSQVFRLGASSSRAAMRQALPRRIAIPARPPNFWRASPVRPLTLVTGLTLGAGTAAVCIKPLETPVLPSFVRKEMLSIDEIVKLLDFSPQTKKQHFEEEEIRHFFNNISVDELVEFAEKNCLENNGKSLKDFAAEHKIGFEEAVSIYAYSLDSWTLNKEIRENNLKTSKDISSKQISHLIDNGLKRLAVPREEPLYRGASLPISIFTSIIKQGVFSDAAFLSTTPNREVAESFATEKPDTESVIFIIEKSKHGADISKLSSYPEQAEILFPSNTGFKVKHPPVKNKNGVYEIHLEEM